MTKIQEELDIISVLCERQQKLNQSFCWTDDKLNILLALNDELTKKMQETIARVESASNDIEMLIQLGKTDYLEHAYCICGFISYEDGFHSLSNYNDCVSSMLEEHLNKVLHLWKIVTNHEHPNVKSEVFTRDWNIMLKQPEFNEHKICYIFYKLVESGYFAFDDLIKFNPKAFSTFVEIHI